MDKIIDNYEFILDNIIKSKNNSINEILLSLRNNKFFENDVLLRIISYLKLSRLYELIYELSPSNKFYMLKLGESNFIFYKNKHCCCINELTDKIHNKNLCIHFLIYKILLFTGKTNQVKIKKEFFEELIISSRNIK